MMLLVSKATLTRQNVSVETMTEKAWKLSAAVALQGGLAELSSSTTEIGVSPHEALEQVRKWISFPLKYTDLTIQSCCSINLKSLTKRLQIAQLHFKMGELCFMFKLPQL